LKSTQQNRPPWGIRSASVPQQLRKYFSTGFRADQSCKQWDSNLIWQSAPLALRSIVERFQVGGSQNSVNHDNCALLLAFTMAAES
jgi:hypothetical protein